MSNLCPKDSVDRLIPCNLTLMHDSPRAHTPHASEHHTMRQTNAERSLAGHLRARINRIAHTQALQQETRVKAVLADHVQNASDSGASFDETAALVDKLEAAPSGEV